MTRLMVIGAAGLDWASFQTMRRARALPSLSSLAEVGEARWLAGAPPGRGVFSPANVAAWTSLATGVWPEVHGLARETEAWSGGTRPVTRASWRASPLWARLEAAGVATGSAGWPGARPGAAWRGRHIDEDYAAPTGRSAEDWAMPLDCAPVGARETLRPLRVHPTQITAKMLAPLAPELATIDQSRDAALPRLAVALARASSLQAAAVWLLGQSGLDAVFLHQPWLGEVRAHFGPRAVAPWDRIVPAAWKFLDALVARLVEVAGKRTRILVVSPGWDLAPGVLLAAGPGIAPEGPIGETPPPGCEALDLAPTILGLLGLAASDLPGRRLFADSRPLGLARPPPSPRPPASPNPALAKAIVAEGYALPVPPNAAWHAQALAELALVVIDRNPGAARDIAARALDFHPESLLALTVKARAHFLLGEAEPLKPIAEVLDRLHGASHAAALSVAAYHILSGKKGLAAPLLRRAEAAEDLASLLATATLWIAIDRAEGAERIFRRMLEIDPQSASAEIGLSMIALSRRDLVEAEAAAHRALALDPGRPAVHLQLSRVCALTGRPVQAERPAADATRLGADPKMAKAAKAGRRPA